MQRIVTVGNTSIALKNLGQPLDGVFDRIYEAWFARSILIWDEVDASAQDFFDGNVGVPARHNDFFGAFTIIWQMLLNSAQYTAAEQLWERCIQPALRWEQQHPGQYVHKGTPLYFWGMTVLLRGDIDWGYLLMHQALEEDIRTLQQNPPDTPGLALVTLNYERLEQAFRGWVLGQAQFLEHTLLADYTATHQRALTLAEVKTRFFQNPPDIETVFLLAYSLARLMRLSSLPVYTTANPFAGQLQLNLLFDIALVIDAAIHSKNPSRWKFSQHAEHLLKVAGHRLSQSQLGRINAQFTNDFDATMEAALDGTLTFPTGSALTRFQCDVALAYGIRNYGAHNTGTARTIWMRFPEVHRGLFRTFFAAVDYLY